MSFLVAGEAPDFVSTAVMADDSFAQQFSLSSLRGKHVVLFFVSGA
jgi:alkyl hydroperoxide reductase subunit AhpC